MFPQMGARHGNAWQAKNLGLKHLHLWGIIFSPAFDRDQTILMNSNYDFYVLTDKGEHWKAFPLGYQGWRTSKIRNPAGTAWASMLSR
jgi:hypothetical protein